MFEIKRYKIYVIAVLLLIVSYFAFFEHLGYEPMHLWDESSYALNAQEMLERGNPIELYLLGKPDLYNTKPPLAIWCMVTSIHFLGFNELGVRLPAAGFGLAAALLLFMIGVRVFEDALKAVYAPLVLISSTGFIGEHITRTGDTDGILAFWILAQCIMLFLYIDTASDKNRQWFLVGAALFVSMGCLTKGVAGLVALPGLLGWVVYKQKGKQLFISPALYIGIGLFVLLVPGYYVLRNILTPGYLDAVYNFEVGGRLWQQEFLNPEPRPFYYFYQSMIEGRLAIWIYVLPIAIGIIVTASKGRAKELGLFFVFTLTSVSIVLGMSSTKLFWYDAPLYPLIAGVIGVAFVILASRLQWYVLILFLGIFYWPYTMVLKQNFTPSNRTYFPAFLKTLRQSPEHQNDSIFIVNADGNFPLHFYAKQDQMNGFYSKLVLPEDTILKKGSLLITEKYAREVDVNQRFIVDTLDSFYECRYYKIVGYK